MNNTTKTLSELSLELEMAERNDTYMYRETPWDDKGFELNDILIANLKKQMIDKGLTEGEYL